MIVCGARVCPHTFDDGLCGGKMKHCIITDAKAVVCEGFQPYTHTHTHTHTRECVCFHTASFGRERFAIDD